MTYTITAGTPFQKHHRDAICAALESASIDPSEIRSVTIDDDGAILTVARYRVDAGGRRFYDHDANEPATVTLPVTSRPKLPSHIVEQVSGHPLHHESEA